MELIGRRFGHIRVTDVVGQGGMGDVYAGYDEKLDRKVALKVLHAEQRLDGEARERLLREARALSKLDHPNICRIHDYIESDDVDLLVLEYIDGRTLQDALRDSMSRAEKLRIASSIAQVLVAAHRLGIIHRDLKPENVMLTRAGEVKVLDFGLARWLTAFSSMRMRPVSAEMLTMQLNAAEPAVVDDWYALDDVGATAVIPTFESMRTGVKRPFMATAVGITMGTPIYMSPEQARGEALTTASDMFSFGLLLQTLFTGAEPHPPGLTAREVILRASRGEILETEGTSGDITTVINRLKQFAPADRPTAVETVTRLRHLAEKPRRIARRAIVAAVIAILVIGGWRYTVDLARERTAAIEARAEAERRRAQAENLIEFMLGDLRNKLEPVGRLDILDAVGERAMAYVQSLNPDVMSVDELVRNAKALNQLGDVRVAQGKLPEALEMFNRSLKLANVAVEREARNPQALLVYGATHFYVGNGLRLQGNTDEALQHMREYMKAGDTLALIDPNREEFQLERAYGHSGLALIQEAKGDYRAALDHYNVALSVKQSLAERDPTDADAQAELARAIDKVGAVLYSLGDLAGAKQRFEREVAIYRRLVEREPQQTQWRNRLANTMAYLARTLRAVGDAEASFALFSEELQIEQGLAARDPANVDWQRNAAVTQRRIAWALTERGETDAALARFRDARAALTAAIAKAPTRAAWPLDLASLDIDYAGALAAAGRRAEARQLLQATIAKVGEPANNRAKLTLAAALTALGEVAHATDPSASTAAYQRAEELLAPFAPGSSDVSELSLWARILALRGRGGEARAVVARLERTGFDTSELRKLCSEAGC